MILDSKIYKELMQIYQQKLIEIKQLMKNDIKQEMVDEKVHMNRSRSMNQIRNFKTIQNKPTYEKREDSHSRSGSVSTQRYVSSFARRQASKMGVTIHASRVNTSFDEDANSRDKELTGDNSSQPKLIFGSNQNSSQPKQSPQP